MVERRVCIGGGHGGDRKRQGSNRAVPSASVAWRVPERGVCCQASSSCSSAAPPSQSAGSTPRLGPPRTTLRRPHPATRHPATRRTTSSSTRDASGTPRMLALDFNRTERDDGRSPTSPSSSSGGARTGRCRSTRRGRRPRTPRPRASRPEAARRAAAFCGSGVPKAQGEPRWLLDWPCSLFCGLGREACHPQAASAARDRPATLHGPLPCTRWKLRACRSPAV